ncbi:hypothetical protein DD878_13595, partial [Staphylococcus pseudintermedius]
VRACARLLGAHRHALSGRNLQHIYKQRANVQLIADAVAVVDLVEARALGCNHLRAARGPGCSWRGEAPDRQGDD